MKKSKGGEEQAVLATERAGREGQAVRDSYVAISFLGKEMHRLYFPDGHDCAVPQ